MEDWENTGTYFGLGLFMLIMFYVIGHMLYNRYHGKDELEGLFRFRKKNNSG